MTRRSFSLCAIGLVIGGCQLINGVSDLEVVPGDATGTGASATGSSSSASGGSAGSAGASTGGTGGEACETGFDVDWAESYGDGLTQGAFGVAIDPPGNTWVVGDAGGVFDIGDFPIDVDEPQDVVGAKLDGEGVPKFAAVAGGLGLQTAWGVAVGDSNAVYIVGQYQGGLDPLAELPPSTKADVFVAKVDEMGNPLWGKGFQGSDDEGKNVNVGFDSMNSRVVVGGNYTGTMQFDSMLLADASGQDIFLAELEAGGGAVAFVTHYGGTGDQTLIGMATGPILPRIAMVGDYDGALDFGDGALPAPRTMERHGFVVLLNESKDVLFSLPLGGGSTVVARAVAFAPGGDVVVAGNFFGGVDLGGELFTATGALDGFVARYTDNGDLRWARHLAGSGSQVPNSVAVAPDGTVWVGGVVEGGALDCGCGELPSGGAEDGFVARFDGQGNAPLCHQFGDGEQQRVTGLAIRDTALRLCGFFAGDMQLGDTTLKAVGQLDLFVAGVTLE